MIKKSNKIKIWYQIICPDNVSRHRSYWDKNEAKLDADKYTNIENGCGRGTQAKDGIFDEGCKLDKGLCPSGKHIVRTRITYLY